MTAAVAVCDCGWRSQPTTPARAAYARRRHSCEKFAVVTARAERVALRRAASGPVRECQHKQARHEHGQRDTYVLDRCRCRPCRDAASAYARWLAKQHAYGHDRYVDAEPARQHCRNLMAAGIGLKRIVILSGVPQGVLWKLVYGKRQADGTQKPSRRIRPSTEAALLAVQPSLDVLGATVCVDGTGTRRRLQALVALGWSQSKLAARLGVQRSNFGGIFTRDDVHARTAKAVRALYDELWNVKPPEDTHRDRIAASRARNYAAAHGWKPPLFYDDDEIDQPWTGKSEADWTADDLDVIAIERAMRGDDVRLTKPERDEAVRRLLALGHNRTEIARRLNLSGQTVNALLARLVVTDDEVAV